jgi:hypothetical protein
MGWGGEDEGGGVFYCGEGEDGPTRYSDGALALGLFHRWRGAAPAGLVPACCLGLVRLGGGARGWTRSVKEQSEKMD